MCGLHVPERRSGTDSLVDVPGAHQHACGVGGAGESGELELGQRHVEACKRPGMGLDSTRKKSDELEEACIGAAAR